MAVVIMSGYPVTAEEGNNEVGEEDRPLIKSKIIEGGKGGHVTKFPPLENYYTDENSIPIVRCKENSLRSSFKMIYVRITELHLGFYLRQLLYSLFHKEMTIIYYSQQLNQ